MTIPPTTEIEVHELEELRRRDRHHLEVIELLIHFGHLDPKRLEQVDDFVRTMTQED